MAYAPEVPGPYLVHGIIAMDYPEYPNGEPIPAVIVQNCGGPIDDPPAIKVRRRQLAARSRRTKAAVAAGGVLLAAVLAGGAKYSGVLELM